MAGTFVIEKGAAGQYRFNLKAGNHEIILTSENYVAKSGVENGIESVRTNSQDDSRFVRKTASDGSPYFILTAENGKTIGKSEMYSSKPAMENGIRSVATNAPTAAVVDKS